MRSALRRWSTFMLLAALPACVSTSPPPFESVDLSALAAQGDVGTVLVAESPAIAFWEDPGGPRDFMGGSRYKPHDQHSLRATEGLAEALIDAGYVVINATALRTALHDLARGDVDREALSALAPTALQDLEPGLKRCLAFDPRSTRARRPVAGADMDPMNTDRPSPVQHEPLTCMDELAAWLWEQHVTAVDPAWVVETAIRADKTYSDRSTMLGGWPSELVQRTQARAWRPGADSEIVATALGLSHPAAPLRALRGLGERRPRDVPRAMPERPDATNPALAMGSAKDLKVTVRPVQKSDFYYWVAEPDGDGLSIAKGCEAAIAPHRFEPASARVAKALVAMWPTRDGPLPVVRCTLRAVRSVLGPDELRFALDCGEDERGALNEARIRVDGASVDVTPVVKQLAAERLDTICKAAYQEDQRWRLEHGVGDPELPRAVAPSPEATVRQIAGRRLPAAYAMTPADAAVVQTYLAKLGDVTATSDAAATCAALSAANEVEDVLSRHVSDVHTRHGYAMFDEPMAEQADEAAEAFTAALPGITVHRGEALYAITNYRELSARDLPPAFKAALADPLLFGDESGRPPHQVLMTDIQICTSVATLSELLPASARAWGKLPTCLRELIAEDVQSSLDTASRGCFCDDEATARRVTPALLERLQAFDELKQWDGKTRSSAVRAALADKESHFDGRCNF